MKPKTLDSERSAKEGFSRRRRKSNISFRTLEEAHGLRHLEAFFIAVVATCATEGALFRLTVCSFASTSFAGIDTTLALCSKSCFEMLPVLETMDNRRCKLDVLPA